MASLLPSQLDERTIPNLLSTLDRLLYPVPTPGFTARMGILWALTSLCLLLALVYLLLHYKSTPERPRSRCLWFIRLVDRPSGRFIVINQRIAWTGIVCFYGTFELVALGSFWRVYHLHHGQEAWIAIRSFNALFLFISGWVFSWAGLSAFLVAVDSGRELLSARTANWIFLGGGTLLLALQLALALVTTILTERFWQRYTALRSALVALQQSLDGRVPTLLDFLPLRDDADAFTSATLAARTPSIIQYSLLVLCPLSILAVNCGGLALAARMRRQVKDSVDLVFLACAGAQAAQRRTASTTQLPASCQPEALGVITTPRQESCDMPGPISGPLQEKPQCKLDPRDVPGDLPCCQGAGSSAAREQARRVLALQKATRDLQTTAGHIAFISLCLIPSTVWLAWCAATDRTANGEWAYIESTAMSPQWIYTVAVTSSLLYLLYNQFQTRKCISELETAPDSMFHLRHNRPDEEVAVALAGAAPSRADLASFGSTQCQRKEDSIELQDLEGQGQPPERSGDRRSAGPSLASPAPFTRSGRRRCPSERAWALWRQRNLDRGEGASGMWRSSWLGRAHTPPQPCAVCSVIVTVETAQVCEHGAEPDRT